MSFTLLRSAQAQPAPIGYIDGKGFTPTDFDTMLLLWNAGTAEARAGALAMAEDDCRRAKAIQQTLAKMEGK